MTYLIGDRYITLSGTSVTEEEERLIRSHPNIFKYCLNSATHAYLLSVKKIIHLYCDVFTIYSTLLMKVPNYDDVTVMTNRTRISLLRLEEDLNKIFGKNLMAVNEGWEHGSYETQVKSMATLILKGCSELFDAVYKNLNCIYVFFLSFDNLKKLQIPCLLKHTQMIQKLISGTTSLFELTTIVDEITKIDQLTPTIIKQLMKIDSITSGTERETKLLDMVYATMNPSLQQYTSILLGKAILKRDVDPADCQIIRRRDLCFEAAEHVVSIPLLGEPSINLSMQHLTKHLFYLASALVVVVVVVLYRLYIVIFG